MQALIVFARAGPIEEPLPVGNLDQLIIIRQSELYVQRSTVELYSACNWILERSKLIIRHRLDWPLPAPTWPGVQTFVQILKNAR